VDDSQRIDLLQMSQFGRYGATQKICMCPSFDKTTETIHQTSRKTEQTNQTNKIQFCQSK